MEILLVAAVCLGTPAVAALLIVLASALETHGVVEAESAATTRPEPR